MKMFILFRRKNHYGSPFMYLIGFTMLCSLVNLSGCDFCGHKLSKEECVCTNWYEQGLLDGRMGVQKTLQKEVADCADCNVLVDVFGYKEGWRRGIREFCIPCNGMAIGAAGKPCPCFCPPDLAGSFRAAWYQGAKCYYTPELGCGDGCAKTYFYPEVPCTWVSNDVGVPPGCPCTDCPPL